ncbi:MAG TPA: 1-acyl-sn-glycerol-3-phosphate acyltransferase [Thermoanaerobaculia bacterium]
MPRPSEGSRRWLVAFVRRVLAVFFRRIEVEGLERVPRHGPLLVVANHVNGLLDPALVLATLPRVPRFLGKSGLWDLALLRPFLAWAEVIPVYRPGDPGVDPAQNAATFAAAAEVLAGGGAVALFPEGKSHDQPGLAPLKTGAARIALAAEAARPGLGVAVLPVGLVFDAKERFRSRALVEIGEPFPALERPAAEAEGRAAQGAAVHGAAAASEAAAGPANDASSTAANGRAAGDDALATAAERATVRALTARIDAALEAVTVSYRDWDEARLVARAAEIWARPTLDVPRKPRLAALADAQRAFVAGYRRLVERHPDRVAEVADAVRAYDRLLHAAGVTDAQLAAEYPLPPVARFLRRTVGTILVRLPLAALGIAANALPYNAVRLVARFVRGADQKATWKVFASLVLYPLTWVAEAAVAGWLVGRAAGGTAGAGAALVVLVVAPGTGLLALRLHDRGSRLAAEARAYLLLRTRRRFADRLRDERRALHRRVGELVELHARETAAEAGEGGEAGAAS